MKRLTVFMSFMLIACVVTAQPPRPPTTEEKLKHTNEVIQKDVELTPTQKATIESAFKKFFAGEEKIRKDNPPPPPPKPDPKVKEAMDKLAKERDETVKKILTTAQYEKYKEALKKLRPPGPGGQQGPPPPPRQ